jgi:hypothetical protein
MKSSRMLWTLDMTSIGKSGFSTLCLALWFIFGELRDSDETPRNLNIVYANLGGGRGGDYANGMGYNGEDVKLRKEGEVIFQGD